MMPSPHSPADDPNGTFETRRAEQHVRVTRQFDHAVRSGLLDDTSTEWGEQTARATVTTRFTTRNGTASDAETTLRCPFIRADLTLHDPDGPENVTSVDVERRTDRDTPAPFDVPVFGSADRSRPPDDFAPGERRHLTPLLRRMLGTIEAQATAAGGPEEDPLKHLSVSVQRTCHADDGPVVRRAHLRWSAGGPALEFTEEQHLPGTGIWQQTERRRIPLNLLTAALTGPPEAHETVLTDRQTAFYHDTVRLLGDVRDRRLADLSIDVLLEHHTRLTLEDELMEAHIGHHLNALEETEAIREEFLDISAKMDRADLPQAHLTALPGGQVHLDATVRQRPVTHTLSLDTCVLLGRCLQEWPNGSQVILDLMTIRTTMLNTEVEQRLRFRPVNALQIAVLASNLDTGSAELMLLNGSDALRPVMTAVRSGLNGPYAAGHGDGA